ncbi:hypothetical protein TruAng_008001 [Truncatella angustata]|nr:hypothetical protein TruAng_008001 [Truncatella angustata]
MNRAKLLLKYGADINQHYNHDSMLRHIILDFFGRPAFEKKLDSQNVCSAVQFLLSNGALVTNTSGASSKTYQPHITVDVMQNPALLNSSHCRKMLRIIFEKGAEVNPQKYGGPSLLVLATGPRGGRHLRCGGSSQSRLVTCLMDHGVDVNAKNSRGVPVLRRVLELPEIPMQLLKSVLFHPRALEIDLKFCKRGCLPLLQTLMGRKALWWCGFRGATHREHPPPERGSAKVNLAAVVGRLLRLGVQLVEGNRLHEACREGNIQRIEELLG